MVPSDGALYSVPRGFPSPLRLDFSSHNHYLDSNNCSGIGDDTRESDNVNHLTRSLSGADIETSVFPVAQDEDENTVEPIRLNAVLVRSKTSTKPNLQSKTIAMVAAYCWTTLRSALLSMLLHSLPKRFSLVVLIHTYRTTA